MLAGIKEKPIDFSNSLINNPQNNLKRNIMIDTKTFIQLAAIVVFVASFAILFLKREDAILLSCLFDIIGWLMLIYCKL